FRRASVLFEERAGFRSVPVSSISIASPISTTLLLDMTSFGPASGGIDNPASAGNPVGGD
ncbi:MAG: hypothetical protein ACJ793_06795, partial [Gemmatimonadaceae bacterium]